ncbi:endonuclease domain-containing protein [Microbacterium paludicola]|uniref:endonuclease domain-containing protein n=1 Tax=Microbacterium paludicola TaxID=300019 RepID=UPI0038799E77
MDDAEVVITPLPLDQQNSLWMWTTAQLRASGMSKHSIAAAVSAGALVRARRGRYVRRDADDDACVAAAISARLTCVTLLSKYGVFVREQPEGVHAHVPRSASRTAVPGEGVLHWRPLSTEAPAEFCAVSVLDALIHASECVDDVDFVAAVDSALHLQLLTRRDLDRLFSAVRPAKRLLRRLVNGRAESGTETIVRLLAIRLGFRVEVQKYIDGVGRVDLLLDGWLVVECDSKAHHSSWDEQREDRRRDQELAKRGYASYRALAEDILFHLDRVEAALRGYLLVGRKRRVGA